MRTSDNDGSIPPPLREVWDWKDTVYRATENMTTAEALRRMHTDTLAARREFGLSVSEPDPIAACVADAAAIYGTAGCRMPREDG